MIRKTTALVRWFSIALLLSTATGCMTLVERSVYRPVEVTTPSAWSLDVETEPLWGGMEIDRAYLEAGDAALRVTCWPARTRLAWIGPLLPIFPTFDLFEHTTEFLSVELELQPGSTALEIDSEQTWLVLEDGREVRPTHLGRGVLQMLEEVDRKRRIHYELHQPEVGSPRFRTLAELSWEEEFVIVQDEPYTSEWSGPGDFLISFPAGEISGEQLELVLGIAERDPIRVSFTFDERTRMSLF